MRLLLIVLTCLMGSACTDSVRQQTAPSSIIAPTPPSDSAGGTFHLMPEFDIEG